MRPREEAIELAATALIDAAEGIEKQVSAVELACGAFTFALRYSTAVLSASSADRVEHNRRVLVAGAEQLAAALRSWPTQVDTTVTH